MNLGSILSELYRRCNYPSSPAAATTTRLTAYVNDTLQDLISEPGLGQWITENIPPLTIASVANQPWYAAPYAMARIDSITDRANNRKLQAKDFAWYRAVQPDPTIFTGTPDTWIPMGFQAVQVQPAAATGLWAASSSGSDTTQSVKLETVQTGGSIFAGSLNLNGTTRVQLGALTTHLEVTQFYLSAVGVGTVSLFDAASSGNTLATIPIGQTFGRWFAFLLYPTPGSAITYYLDGENALPDMSNLTDEPPIPLRFHRVLVDGAEWRELLKTDDSRATTARQRYEHGVSQLRYFVTCPPDFLPSRGRGGPERSRFGAMYPTTRY